jgi:hypothetical protein
MHNIFCHFYRLKPGLESGFQTRNTLRDIEMVFISFYLHSKFNPLLAKIPLTGNQSKFKENKSSKM